MTESNLIEYLVVLERTSRNYGAYSPDLPGCVATGRTPEETLESMREAITMHIDGLKTDGLRIPDSISRGDYIRVAI
ncbi:MAG: type II toxin-antitoxin system HicB family antitoxin [Candidatus Dormibacteraceae bacterium]